MIRKIHCLIACFCLASATVQAADIYRWVDEAGRTHLGDKVPERYRGVAKKMDTAPAQLTPQQRREAEARAARERAQAGRLPAATPTPTPIPDAPAAGVIDPATPPARERQGETECERQRRLYRESQECFAPYLRGDAGVRPEAYKVCKEVRDPGNTCTERNY